MAICVSCSSWADLGIEHDKYDCDSPSCPCKHSPPGTLIRPRPVAA